jgi:hypothetical protein
MAATFTPDEEAEIELMLWPVFLQLARDVRPFWYRRESAGEAGCPFRNRMATNYAISLSSETTSISWIRVNFSLGLPFGLPRSISAASSISQF